ncbi:hypothetical protein [Spirochaeta africana]|uniref:Uncharacterized protein n=1 Tax=Spirochaeta africana (strain ATCC 700263 / DSM 8902 / Z-7692) TaxID=889378 RepID=H9UM22_SPIAZ|nr:hypothetical protein [Spirochaeta africana]AFG38565.1 hypothetical protein Spiaf_2535 [Spirochaeta africana DSM 8902]
MKRWSCVAALLLLGAGFSGISALQVLESTYFPPQFFVGDRVEHVLIVRSERAEHLREPEQLPVSQWVEIHSLQVQPHPGRDTAEIRMSFSAFVPGTLTLPAINLGPETLRGREVLVRSLQPEYGNELREARDQLLLPGTTLSLWLISAVVVLLPLFWLMISHYGHNWLAAVSARLSAIRPYRRLRSGLRRLARNLDSLSAKDFYIELLSSLRQYFSEKTGQDCMSATTYEVSRILDTLTDNPDAVRELQEVFRYGDLVKFAGAAAPVDVRRQHLAKVFRVAAVIEQKEPDLPPQVMRHVHT